MIQFKIPIPEKISANKVYSGVHWTKRKQWADLYHSTFIGTKEKVKDYPVEIEYKFTFKSRPLDTSNCFFLVKLLEDSLVKNKVIEDDSPKFVACTIVYSDKGEEDEVSIKIS